MKKLLLLLLLTLNIASAETIQFIVKSSAGGPDDTLTRTIQEHLEKDTDLRFTVINKPGAAHMIGYSSFQDHVGPSIIIADNNIKKHTVFEMSENLYTLGTFSNILYVRKDSGIEKIDDLISLSKQRPIKFGHGGEGTFSHLSAEKLCSTVLNCIEIPYKSGNPGMVDLMGGHIDAFALISYGSDQYFKNDKLKAIMFYSTNGHKKYNIPLLPKNLQKLEIKNWIAIFGRNLTEEQKIQITNSLKKLDKKTIEEYGLWSQ